MCTYSNQNNTCSLHYQYTTRALYTITMYYLNRSDYVTLKNTQMADMADKRQAAELFDVSNISYSSQLLRTMNDFRKEGMFCDVIINVKGGQTFAAHCTVLASASQYFRKLFSFNSRSRNGHFVVNLEWLYPEDVGEILDFMYTGQIQLGDNAEFILTAATYFIIESLQEVVKDFLQEHLNLYNCFSILSVADDHSLQALKATCTRFISENFVQASGSPSFLSLDKTLLEEVISNDDLAVTNEKDVFNAVMRWIKHDSDNRAFHLEDLFSCVHLRGMSRDVLLNIVARETLVRESNTCLSLVQDALQTVGLDEDISINNTEVSKEFISGFVMCGGTGSKYVTQNIKHTVCYVPSIGKWFDLPDMLHGRKGHSTVLCNGVLYSIGHHSVFSQEGSRLVQCFVPGGSAWNTRASLPRGSCFSAAVALQGQVYVLGGIHHEKDGTTVSARVNRYNPAVDRWYPVTSMNYARQGLCAVVLDGNILAIGGSGVDDTFLRTVERYEPQQDRWILVDSMMKRRCFASAAVVSGRVLVVGGRENDHDSGILDSCEMYDPTSDQWTVEPGRLNTARCAAGIGALANRVFVFGGESEEDALDSVECWDVEARQWTIATHMPFSAFHVQSEVLCLPKKDLMSI